jgi:predicted helicase
VPRDTELLEEYEQGWKVIEVFPVNNVGLFTSRDALTIRWSPEDVWRTVTDFAALPPEEARSKYKLGRDVRDWRVEWAQRDLRASGLSKDKIVPILYRPFDVRYTYYTGNSKGFHCMPRGKVMYHILVGENVGLNICRQTISQSWLHVLSTNRITEYSYVSSRTRERDYIFPLYLYPDTGELGIDTDRRPNLSPAFLKALAEKLNLPQTGPDGLPEGITPEDIFYYAYAVFHSPIYRKRYAEFLKVDFPRLPLTSDIGLFKKLAEVGGELVALHLIESPRLDDFITHYPVRGSDEVEKVSYIEQDRRVYINPRQYFEGVPPEVWEFCVGGYQVCEKWLKDRKGRKLSYDDQKHYQRIVVALKETIQKMEDIDRIIPSWPIE